MNRPIFIVGFMGSGKTTLGKKIAAAMGRTFIDLDHEIVAHIGMSIPEYFKAFGESNFRELEREFLRKQKGNNAIISTGGGTPCFFDNMQWITQNGLALYLEHSPKSLWSRLSQSDVNKRPVLKGLNGEELLTFIETKLEDRAPFYNQSQLKVDQMHTSIEQIVQLINNYKTDSV
ncbi:shikimate kinase [Sphingobacterium yanglingense]|uniref:Shikimate kinase n=1 Tax=Sphingobacterium yanglingense TaxID=1437280 RepID=A0A4R6WPW4_9SPHI|nr:shikimate kinase [Sphingobacterium yanglingense]TDQ81224.1 shikimate kinase [Sphingobacterium yanglingense]